MSVKEATYYSLVCDFPGCGVDADYGDYSAYAEKSAAIEYALDSDWREDADGQRHYCHRHPMQWDVDVEDGDKPLDPPHLLMRDADGKVTLVTGPQERAANVLPLHRTEAGYPNCSTCDGGGCPDCTDPA